MIDANGDPFLDPDGDPVYEHGAAFRTAVAGAALRLCSAFEAAEKAYRTAMGETGSEKKVRYREPLFPPLFFFFFSWKPSIY